MLRRTTAAAPCHAAKSARKFMTYTGNKDGNLVLPNGSGKVRVRRIDRRENLIDAATLEAAGVGVGTGAAAADGNKGGIAGSAAASVDGSNKGGGASTSSGIRTCAQHRGATDESN